MSGLDENIKWDPPKNPKLDFFIEYACSYRSYIIVSSLIKAGHALYS
jgi:hypothetical protein